MRILAERLDASTRKLRRALSWLAPQLVIISSASAVVSATLKLVSAYPYSAALIAFILPAGIAWLSLRDLRKAGHVSPKRIAATLTRKTTLISTPIAILGIVYLMASSIAAHLALHALRNNDASRYMGYQLFSTYYGDQQELYAADRLEKGAYNTSLLDCSAAADDRRLQLSGSVRLDDQHKQDLLLAQEECAHRRHDSVAVAFYAERRHAYHFAFGHDAMSQVEEALFSVRDPLAAKMLATQAWLSEPNDLRPYFLNANRSSTMRYLLASALKSKRELCNADYSRFQFRVDAKCLGRL